MEYFLPEILFAHQFAADMYHGCLPKSENKIEITLITDGELAVMQGSKRDIARKGDIICNVYREALLVDTDAHHSHMTVGFSANPSMIDRISEIPLVTHSTDSTSVCFSLIDKLIRANILNPENTLTCAGLLFQLLGELERISRRGDLLRASGDFRYVEQAKQYVYKHISDPIMQKDIAEHLGITPEYLCCVFKKLEGCSVIRFVNETKLTHIRTMMKNKNLSLGQAASQFGFSDPNYVSKLYKKYYHETITQAAKR